MPLTLSNVEINWFIVSVNCCLSCDGLYSTLIGGQRNKYTLSAMPIIMLILCLGSLITFKVLELCFENKKRNVNDSDIYKVAKSEKAYEKMIYFCETKKLEYIVIDTSDKLPEEIVDLIIKRIEEIK